MLSIEEDVRPLHQNQFRDSQAEGNKPSTNQTHRKTPVPGEGRKGSSKCHSALQAEQTHRLQCHPKGRLGVFSHPHSATGRITHNFLFDRQMLKLIASTLTKPTLPSEVTCSFPTLPSKRLSLCLTAKTFFLTS